jgi:hypothetical protein
MNTYRAKIIIQRAREQEREVRKTINQFLQFFFILLFYNLKDQSLKV